MAETTDLLIRLRSDASGVEEGNRRAKQSFTELNQAAELAAKAFNGLSSAAGALVNIINRGQGVSELSNAFKNLGGTSEGLESLRSSVQGLVSDTNLMRAANEALLSGLTPDQFERIAKAADSLGDAVGVNTKDAMDQLTRAVNTGNERLLKQYGIVIDNKKAEEDFAKQIGITADHLNEAGKKEAARIAILEKMDEQVRKTGEGHLTAGDAVQRLGVVIDNTVDSLAQAVNENQELAKAIDEVAANLSQVDWKPLIDGAIAATKVIAALIEQIGNFNRGLDIILNRSSQAKVYNLNEQISGLQNERGSAWSDWGRASIDKQIAALTTQRDAIINSERAMGDLGTTLNTIQELYGKATGGIASFNGKLVYNKELFIDTGKAAADAGKKGLQEFNDTLEVFKNLGDDVIGAAGSGTFFEKVVGATDTTEATKKLEEAFQGSVDFFSDLLTPMFEGQAANFEDIFSDAAKRIAIGFASQMLASLTGLNIGGGAAGLGQSLAATLGFGGGGVAGIGNIFSALGFGGGGTSGIGPVADGGAYASMLGGGGGISAILTAAAPAIAAAGVAAVAYSNKDVLSGGKLNTAGQLALALPTGGLSFLANSFLGDSEKSKERKEREALLDKIFGGDASFQGVNGKINLNSRNFNSGGGFGGQASALVNPLAEVLGGGGKLGDDLSGIFEAGVSDAENFNEVIVNTLALMDKLNVNAEDAKNQLSELFLDGKISLDEFSVGVDNLNILAQEDLVGPNSVADAIGIVTKNLDNPRVALKGVELAFKEMAQLGIDTQSEVAAYLTDKFGPDIAQAFEHIQAAGIDTWQEVGNAGPEQLRLIFKELSPLQQVFEDTADSAKKLGDQNMDKINNGLKNVKTNAEKAREALEKMNREASKATSGGDENPPNNPNNP